MCKFQKKLPESLEECFTCRSKCNPYKEIKSLKNFKNKEKIKEVRSYFSGKTDTYGK